MNHWNKAIKAFELLFGEKPRLDDFDSRMKFQKATYLTKLIGVNFEGISFTWYKRGPYSFEIGGCYPHGSQSGHGMTREETDRVIQHKDTLASLLRDPKSAELYSSAAYLVFEERLSDQQALAKMMIMKPWFKNKEILLAIQKVKEIFTNKA